MALKFPLSELLNIINGISLHMIWRKLSFNVVFLIVIIYVLFSGCVNENKSSNINPKDIVIKDFKWVGTTGQTWEAIIQSNYKGNEIPSLHFSGDGYDEELTQLYGLNYGLDRLYSGTFNRIPSISGNNGKKGELSIIEKNGQKIDTKIIDMPYYGIEVITSNTIGQNGGYIEIKNIGNTQHDLTFYRGDGNSGAELVIDGSIEGSNGWFTLKPQETKRFNVNLNYPSWQYPFVYEGYDANGVKSTHYTIPKEGTKEYIISINYYDGNDLKYYKMKIFQIHYNIEK